MRYLLFFVVLFSYGEEGTIWDRLTVLKFLHKPRN